MTSIGLIQFASLLGDGFSCAVRIGDIMEHDTIRKLDSFLSEAQKVQAYELQEDYPLTQTQLGIFVDSNNAKESTAYNIPVYITLDQRVDLGRLAEAIQKTIKAHPYILTTLFANEKGEIRAKRNDEKPVEVQHVVLSTLPAPDDLVVPYHMLESPLYRIIIYQTPEGNVLFMDFHHIIADGTSMAILLTDLSNAYKGNNEKNPRRISLSASSPRS